MIRIGLTGGTGAGKSTVARTLAAEGAYVVDADVVAREVVEPGTNGFDELVAAFGPGIVAADGSLDRAALAAKAFTDDEHRGRMNAITHPRIMARTQELFAAAPDDAVVVHDVPLLVELHTAPMYHLVVVVHADHEERVRRLTTWRGMAEEDARARIAAQASDADRRAVADVWLDNSETEGELRADTIRLWEDRLVPFERNVRERRDAVDLNVDPGDRDVLGARLVNRLWLLCGDKAIEVYVAGTEPVVEMRVTARDAQAAADLVDVLADGGFPQITPGLHGSADPGRPVTVTVRTAG
ncbi:MAG: dephospho-CoA kinase [Gordonia sp. (in: high G+C Gram-positive bacteria)]|uniref:dephospho-CoA kinase n=1 Tax=Gordonia sp. (in: high G+C Gram-positive bacteria) TaxID=84139 RepID=UPI0039E346D0